METSLITSEEVRQLLAAEWAPLLAYAALLGGGVLALTGLGRETDSEADSPGLEHRSLNGGW